LICALVAVQVDRRGADAVAEVVAAVEGQRTLDGVSVVQMLYVEVVVVVFKLKSMPSLESVMMALISPENT
jgi:hypothetical protein